MTFQSQSGSVGFRTQASKGTYLSPAAGVFMKLQGGALGGTRDLLIPDSEIGGSRDITDAYLGTIKFEGEYDFYPRYDSVATLLYGALGAKSSATNGSAGALLVGTHTITPIDTGSLPWLSIEENIADNFDHFQYTDAKVKTFHLEAAADGYLMGKCELVALTQNAVISASATASPPWDNGPLTVGSNTFVTFDGTRLPAQNFAFDLNNNLEDTDFRIGSLFLGDAGEKRREATVGLKIRPADHSYWRQAMYGDASLSSAGGLVTKKQVVITTQTYEFIGNTATVYSLTLTAPQAIIKPVALAPKGDDIIEHDIVIEFIRPNPATPLLTAVVTNHQATVL